MKSLPKTREDIEYERNKDHCTFRPDLKKTNKVNQRVDRAYKSKEINKKIGKENKSNNNQNVKCN